jgi:hypothetical protein
MVRDQVARLEVVVLSYGEWTELLGLVRAAIDSAEPGLEQGKYIAIVERLKDGHSLTVGVTTSVV